VKQFLAGSAFGKATRALYEEAARHGSDQVVLKTESGRELLVVNNCRPQLADQWRDFATTASQWGESVSAHLHLFCVVLKSTIAVNKALLIEVDSPEVVISLEIDLVA
jgi:hypothetical protein